MNNKFGASQVVGWENSAQGIIDSTIPQTYLFKNNVVNTGTVPAMLQVLLSNFTDDGAVQLNARAYLTTTVQPNGSHGDITIPVDNIVLDEGIKTLRVSTLVFGTDDADQYSECIGSDESEFIVGFA